MKGLELARQYYEAFGKEMLKEQFGEVLPKLAIGLMGSGSECSGFDDETSRDHDFEPAFCIFLPDESLVDRKTAFQLERAYAKLPREFMEFARSNTDPVGGSRHGVIRTADFFLAKTGSPVGELSAEEWLRVPEYSLLEATNGLVFEDHFGQLTEIRERLRFYPEDIRLKKLAGHLLIMGQAGQYNYLRCLKRGDTAAAQLAVFEFAKSALHIIYLLNRAYMPYYKWAFRGLEGLKKLSELSGELEFLISSDNTPENAAKKAETIENICAAVTKELMAEGLSHLQSNETEQQAYIVNNKISDHNIRNLHILYGI